MFTCQVHFINNWQHAAMYQSVLMSGLVDLLDLRLDLPEGCRAAFLGLAFLNQGLLMGLHAKHEPLDALCHKLLTALFLVRSIPETHIPIYKFAKCAPSLM